LHFHFMANIISTSKIDTGKHFIGIFLAKNENVLKKAAIKLFVTITIIISAIYLRLPTARGT